MRRTFIASYNQHPHMLESGMSKTTVARVRMLCSGKEPYPDPPP